MGFKEDLYRIGRENGTKALTNYDIARYFGKDVKTVQRLINYHKIPVIKKGVYLIADIEDINPFEVAYLIDKDSYISLDTALYHYHLIPEIVRPNYSVTLKSPKTHSNSIGKFIYRHIKEDMLFGYLFDKDFSYRIAEKEKAILDYMYFSNLRITENIVRSVEAGNMKTDAVINIYKWFQSERFQNLDSLNFSKLLKYGKRMNKKVYVMAKALEGYYNSEYYENHA